MTRQNINIGALANDGTGDTLRAAGQKINENFVEIYQLLGGDSDFPSTGVQIGTSTIIFEGTTIDNVTTTLQVVDPTSNNVITLPDATGTIMLTDDSATMSNKILVRPTVKLLSLEDDDSSHQYNVITGSLTANTNINIPTLSDSDTFVMLDAAQTLTNKTLTTPTISTPQITSSINDTNNAEIIKFSVASSAVNEITVGNAATNNSPTIAATGGDTNISLTLSAKGTGALISNTKIAVGSETKTASGSISLLKPLTIFNSGSALGMSLANGVTVGEIKYLINRNAGTVTITPTSLAGTGTTIVLTENQAATVMWGGSNWFVVSKQSNA